MRILLATTLALTLAALALAGTASADRFGVGDCQKNGLCAGGCVAVTTPCNGDLACGGVSYEVPFCVEEPPIAVAPLPSACVTEAFNSHGDPAACPGTVCVGRGAEWLLCYGHPVPPCVNICI
ncbi:MAG: hypothetical protein QOI63_1247 [Thermoplasmata archaeon]|jgi:hypothetical protein|nr:hypothetical protein [Thermoplasmata archaeon]